MEDIGHLVAGLEQFVRAYGAAAVLVIIMLEAFGMPLPGESLLIFSAALAGRGEMSLPALLICAWAGAVIGDNVGYVIGRSAAPRSPGLAPRSASLRRASAGSKGCSRATAL